MGTVARLLAALGSDKELVPGLDALKQWHEGASAVQRECVFESAARQAATRYVRSVDRRFQGARSSTTDWADAAPVRPLEDSQQLLHDAMADLEPANDAGADAAAAAAAAAAAEAEPAIASERAEMRIVRVGPKQPWFADELERLRTALAIHGRNWIAVQELVGTKSRRQCESKVLNEVSAGRMLAPQGKQVQLPWTKLETAILRLSVARHGRDWHGVAADVGTKTKQQCENKAAHEVGAGRMPEPPRKQEHRSWTAVEVQRLHAAVQKHGSNWVAVSEAVGTKTSQQCQDKLTSEVSKGRMPWPGGPRKRRFAWTRREQHKLRNAIVQFGRDWVAIAKHVGTKSRQQCLDKVRIEVAAGRLAKDPFDPATQQPVSEEESDDDENDGAHHHLNTHHGGGAASSAAGSSGGDDAESETDRASARPSTRTTSQP
jgi:hypothetical protein